MVDTPFIFFAAKWWCLFVLFQ